MKLCITRGLLLLALAATVAAVGTAQAHGSKHVHGEMALDVALDGTVLQVQLKAPLDSLVGFERRPRSEAEKRAAAAALATLRDPARWLQPDAAAGCAPGAVELDAGPLEGDAATGGHADVELTVQWRCTQPAALAGLGVGLFEAFPRTRRIEVQVAGGSGPAKQTLRPAAARVRFTR